MRKQDKKDIVTPKSGASKLLNVFAGFLMLILPLVQYKAAQDAVLMPRLFAVSLFLFLFSGILLMRKNTVPPDLSIYRSPVFLLLASYLLVVILSSVLAFNPQEGYFDIARTLVFVVLVSCWARFISKNKEWYYTLSKLVIISASISVVVGLYQYFSQVVGHSATHLSGGRELINLVVGLMANKNLFSSYLMLMIPFLLYGIWMLKGSWRIVGIITGISVLALIVILGTRAVWVAIMVSFVVTALLVLAFSRKLEIPPKQKSKFAIFASILILVLVSLIAIGERGTKNSYLEKLGSIARPEVGNNHFRLDIWKVTAEMTLDHPLTGVGAGNWQIAIPEYYSRIGLKGKEVNWQTPHNDFLWIASEKGLPGLLLFLAIVALVSFYVFRIITQQGSREDKIKAILLFSGLLAYLTESFFDFPYQRIDHQVYFSLFIAGIVAIYRQQHTPNPLKINRYISGTLISVALLFSVIYSYKAVQLEIQVKKSVSLMNKGKQQQAIAGFEKAETVFRNFDAEGSPVSYYAGLAYANLNEHQKAIPLFVKALGQHPNHVALLNNTGLSYLKTGDTLQATRYFLKALKIVPDYKEARVNLSTIYYKEGNYAESLKMLLGVKNKKQLPEIRQNIRALNKLMGYPEDSLVKDKKHHKRNKGKHKAKVKKMPTE